MPGAYVSLAEYPFDMVRLASFSTVRTSSWATSTALAPTDPSGAT